LIGCCNPEWRILPQALINSINLELILLSIATLGLSGWGITTAHQSFGLLDSRTIIAIIVDGVLLILDIVAFFAELSRPHRESIKRDLKEQSKAFWKGLKCFPRVVWISTTGLAHDKGIAFWKWVKGRGLTIRRWLKYTMKVLLISTRGLARGWTSQTEVIEMGDLGAFIERYNSVYRR
jgi:hypothetical protein